MKIFHQRKLNRLKNFDYSSTGYYFVTICTKNKEECFGEVKNRKMILNQYGKIVQWRWLTITKYFQNVLLDEFIVMPNHLHGIIVIKQIFHAVGTGHCSVPTNDGNNTRYGLLSKIINGV